MGMSPQDYEYLLVAVRVPRTQSDRSFLNSKEWVNTAAIQIAGSKCGGTFESAKHITNHIHLIVQAGCCVASRCAAISSSCRPLTAPPSCRLIVQAGCCVASRCVAVSSSCRAAILSSHCVALSSSHHAIWLLRFYGTTSFLRKGWRKICCRCRISRNRSYHAAATALPPSRCASPPQRHRQSAANVTQSRCRHRRRH